MTMPEPGEEELPAMRNGARTWRSLSLAGATAFAIGAIAAAFGIDYLDHPGHYLAGAATAGIAIAVALLVAEKEDAA